MTYNSTPSRNSGSDKLPGLLLKPKGGCADMVFMLSLPKFAEAKVGKVAKPDDTRACIQLGMNKGAAGE